MLQKAQEADESLPQFKTKKITVVNLNVGAKFTSSEIVKAS